ncbi:MAG: hypothetical protein FWF35_01380 [Elusimicrobia bacterium]|nr:hypothetical protein [Elusimicrobiota bacterium]
MEHSLAWFLWALRAAAKERGDFIAGFFGRQECSADETKENLTKIGIKYE